ncbi:CREC-EF hand family protein [Formosa algae]|uniref:EF-hand domain-containing protein n=1 Tax=Formosa algae TaxID=225843 RepID=A0A9X0YRE9_9FLAO|nr:EF-hand domain-containing protein [Formosa algae]MBP1841613.1 hypothetical protein [Formosa algae]MDQ0336994.1 hypothetical protein [Formosa algae]
MKRILLLGAFACVFFACESKKDKKAEQQTTVEADTRKTEKAHPDRRPGGPPTFDTLLSEMDTNKDGKLAENELKGPIAESFSEIDTDGDGFVSKTELENAPKPEGGQRPPGKK